MQLLFRALRLNGAAAGPRAGPAYAEAATLPFGPRNSPTILVASELTAALTTPLLQFPAKPFTAPNAFHVPQAQAALRAGKQVLVQKPLATSSAAARETIDMAAAEGRILFVDYSYRLLETATGPGDFVGMSGEATGHVDLTDPDPTAVATGRFRCHR